MTTKRRAASSRKSYAQRVREAEALRRKTRREIVSALMGDDPALRRRAAREMFDVIDLYYIPLYALRQAFRDEDVGVRRNAAIALLVKKVSPWRSRELARVLRSVSGEDADRRVIEAARNLRDLAAVKAILAPLFERALWDDDPKVRGPAAGLLSWATSATGVPPDAVPRLFEMLVDPSTVRWAGLVLLAVVARGAAAPLVERLAELTRSKELGEEATSLLLAAADQRLDIAAALPALAAFPVADGRDAATWAMVRHFWNTRQLAELSRLVPPRLQDPTEYSTITISDRPTHGRRGVPVDGRYAGRRCGYCGNPEVLGIYWASERGNSGGPTWWELQCDECGKFSFYEDID